jgi:hypothetical protein
MRSVRLPLLLPLLLGTSPLSAQTTAELVDRLAKAKSVDHASVGEGGGKTDTYKTYEQLAAKATTDELQKLTSHVSPIVRCYAVWALSARKAKTDWRKLMAASDSTARSAT